MPDDYLWDRSGPVDPEIAQLEELLSPLRQATWKAPPAGGIAAVRPRRALALLAAALVVLVSGPVWHVSRSAPAAGWAVSRVAGSPTIALRPMSARDELHVGGALHTDAESRAQLEVPDIGYVDVDPRSRIELLRSGAGHHRLRLAYGTLHAFIVAPPGQFVVDTSSATAVDLGCAYTLRVDERGVGSVRVTSGWVGFEWQGRESFIPAGAICRTRPRVGPGTPHYEDVSEAFRRALDTLDFGSPEGYARTQALDLVLGEARAQDALTLWHLLPRVAPAERARVFGRLGQLVPPPAGVTVQHVLDGDPTALDRWWGELGFGDIATWRTWKQQWADQTAR